MRTQPAALGACAAPLDATAIRQTATSARLVCADFEALVRPSAAAPLLVYACDGQLQRINASRTANAVGQVCTERAERRALTKSHADRRGGGGKGNGESEDESTSHMQINWRRVKKLPFEFYLFRSLWASCPIQC